MSTTVPTVKDEELEQLVEGLLDYKVGRYQKFDDACGGEMEGFRLNIVLFGMTGSGKSALINTIFECLEMDIRPAVTQTTGREGTKILESCDLLPNNVTVYDTRGFSDFGKTEEGRNVSVLTQFYFAQYSTCLLVQRIESPEARCSHNFVPLRSQRIDKPKFRRTIVFKVSFDSVQNVPR